MSPFPSALLRMMKIIIAMTLKMKEIYTHIHWINERVCTVCWGSTNKKQTILRYPFCRQDKGELVFDHWERDTHTHKHTRWLISFHLLQSQTGRLRQAYQSTSQSLFKICTYGIFLIYFFFNSIKKVPLVVRGRSSHEHGMWKSLPSVHYNQKEQRERKRKNWLKWLLLQEHYSPSNLTQKILIGKTSWKY